MREACEASGRDPVTLGLSVTLTTVCGVDRHDLDRRAAVSPQQFEMADLRGSPDEVADQLGRYRDLGATQGYLRILDLRDLDQIALLGAAVLPTFAAD